MLKNYRLLDVIKLDDNFHVTRVWGVALLSSALGNLISLVGIALLVNMLGDEVFGKAVFFTNAAVALSTITTSGICLHILRITARSVSEDEVNSHIWTAIILGQCVASLITISLLCISIFSDERSLFEYFLIGIAIHFITFDALFKNRLIGSRRLIILAIATVIGVIGAFGLQFFGAWLYGAQGYMMGFTVGAALQAASTWLACRFVLSRLGGWPREVFQRMRDWSAFKFIALTTLSACLVPLTHWLASLITIYKVGDYGEVANLTIAMQFFNMVMFIPVITNKIILPKTIHDDLNRDFDVSRKQIYRQMKKIILLTFPALPLVWLISDPIMSIYKFTTADGVTAILYFVGAGILASAAIPFSNHFVSYSKVNSGFVSNLIWVISYLGLIFVIPGGAISVGESLIYAYILNFFVLNYLVKVRADV